MDICLNGGNSFMILFVWIVMAVLPAVIGAGMMTIVYRKKPQERIRFSDSYLLGLIACVGMGEAAHVIGLFGKLPLSKAGLLWGGLTIVVTMGAFVFALYGFFKDKKRYRLKLVGENVALWLPVVFILLFLGQMLFIYCMKPLVTAGDITMETVQSFLAQDGIYQVLPLTGAVSPQGMPVRYTILGLPTMYAVLAQGFSLEPTLLVCHIVPIVVLAAAYLAYYRLSSTLFGEEKLQQRFLFLLLVALLFTFSDNAIFLDGYGALHSGYTGTAIRNLVLVPYTLCAALEGRWWKAVLCILAEACIAWTLWGCGVCLIIALGILILEILDKKVPAVSRFLQFFREKEGLS